MSEPTPALPEHEYVIKVCFLVSSTGSRLKAIEEVRALIQDKRVPSTDFYIQDATRTEDLHALIHKRTAP